MLRRHFDRAPGNCRHIGRELHRVIHIFEVLPRALAGRRQNNDRAKAVIACDGITDFRIAVHGGYGQAAVFHAAFKSDKLPFQRTARNLQALAVACYSRHRHGNARSSSRGALDTPVVNATRSSAPSTLTCIVAFVLPLTAVSVEVPGFVALMLCPLTARLPLLDFQVGLIEPASIGL